MGVSHWGLFLAHRDDIRFGCGQPTHEFGQLIGEGASLLFVAVQLIHVRRMRFVSGKGHADTRI